MWTVSRLDKKERERLAYMLNHITPYGRRVPKFNGEEIVAFPATCCARVYEGFFRTLALIVFQIPGREVSEEAKLWRMFAESAIMVWEED
jgi:hypothetical protein